MKVHVLLLGIGIFFNLAALCLLWWDGANQPYIDNNFSYNADVIDAESVYDKAHNNFIGTRYSNSRLQLNIAKSGSDTAITSKFTKNTDTEKPDEVSYQRKINATTGQYLSDTTNEEDGYVFAPRSLKENTSFYHKVTKSGVSVPMQLVGREVIDGLDVYHYKADYSKVAKLQGDQSSGQALEYVPESHIWVEPVSGWMVKYQDDSTLNAYDRATNVVISPVRHFSSVMDDASVAQHVAYAKGLHLKQVFSNQVAPSIILLVLTMTVFAVLLLRLKSPKTIPINVALVVITIVPSIVLLGWLTHIVPLTSLFVDKIGMNPLSAICFILTGLAIMARRNKRPLVMAFLGGFIVIIATLQLLGSMDILPFQVDLLLFKDAILELGDVLPSRMSPFEAFTFLVLGVVLLKAGYTTRRTPFHFARFVSGVVVTLGIFGVLLQFLRIERAFTITFVQTLSTISPLLFIICGFTLSQLFRRIHDKPDDIRSMLRALLWPSLATVPLIIIGIFAQIQQNIVRQTLQANFNGTISDIESVLKNRVDIFATTLTGAEALFASSQEVTDLEWHSFVATFSLTKQYSDLRDMGYAKEVPANSSYVVPFSTSPKLDIFPATSMETVRTPIVYIDSQPGQNTKQAGQDLFIDVAHSNAMREARDTGKPRLASRLSGPTEQASDVVLFVPVYKQGSVVATVEDRRNAIEGYVFSSIDTKKLANRIAGSKAGDVDFEVYDGLELKTESLLSQRHTRISENARLTSKSTIFLAGHPWTIVYAAPSDFQLSLGEELSPSIILIGGSLGYFSLTSIGYLIVMLNRRTQQASRERNVRRDSK